MKDNKKLSDHLLGKMAEVISHATDVSREEALAQASKEQDQMEKELKTLQDETKQKLKERLQVVLRAVAPEFQKPEYRAFFERLSDNFLRAFQQYTGANDKSIIERSYPSIETNILSSFVASVPRATGSTSARANDLMNMRIDEILQKAELGLDSKDRSGLVGALLDTLRVYAGLSKIGLKEISESRYKEAEEDILRKLRGLLSRSRNTEAEAELEEHLKAPLEVAELRLLDYEMRNLTDQLIWLFRDYINAPDEKKDEVYSQGEDRIVFSMFDSHFLKSIRTHTP